MGDATPRILVVEDEAEIRRFVRLALQREGFDVFEADGVQRGLIEAGTRHPDLVVLDLGLPDGDGSQVVDALRNNRVLAGIPLLVYTARDLRQEDRDRLVLGPTRYLTKSREAEDEFRSVVLELLAAGARKPA